MGGNRFGKECWGVFVCVVSQGLGALISAPLSVGGGSHHSEGVEGHQLSLESFLSHSSVSYTHLTLPTSLRV